MEFKKYMHVETLGKDEVEGILDGEVFVFPKLDGANASVYMDDGGVIHGCSRNRDLLGAKDNHGFQSYTNDHDALFRSYFDGYPKRRLYGEWLVPHTLKTYRDDAWKKFYIFDVEDENGDFLSYECYSDLLLALGFNVVPCVATGRNIQPESLIHNLNHNTYLIKDGMGNGEGFVIKRYDFKNKYGRTVWAKLVQNEFKEKNGVEFGPKTINSSSELERKIAEESVTQGRVRKVLSKMGWVDGDSKNIPRLLNTVYYEVVTEELWEALKQEKNPTINFNQLQRNVFSMVKKVCPEIF